MDQNITNKSLVNIETFDTDYSDCKGCQNGINFCKRPCWATPSEVSKLLAAGYGDRLMLDMWGRSRKEGGHIFIITPATPGCESTYAPDVEMLSMDDDQLAKMDPEKLMEFMVKEMMGAMTGTGSIQKGCNFQTTEGLCQLHEVRLKPFEGRRTCCKVDGEGIHEAVAMTWDSEEGKEVVNQWKEKHFKL